MKARKARTQLIRDAALATGKTCIACGAEAITRVGDYPVCERPGPRYSRQTPNRAGRRTFEVATGASEPEGRSVSDAVARVTLLDTMMKRLDFSKPHILRNEKEYDAAVAEMDALLDRHPPEGSPEHDRLELLSVLVEAYDEEHHAMGTTATPQAVVEFLLEQQGMTRANLASVLGGRSH